MVKLTQSDLQFLFDQVTFDPADLVGLEDHRGIRNVSGQGNNLVPGQENFGAADQDFIQLAQGSQPDDYSNYDFTAPPPGPGLPSDGIVVIDGTPRMISNVIADQGTTVIENVAADAGARPFNGWMTMFGQFFDHGLDFVGKGAQGFVMVPLDPSDPLYNPAPGAPNFMIVSRANVSNLAEAGADRIFGTTDDVGYSDNGTANTGDDTFATPRQVNLTSPFIDQNQTYGSSVAIRTVLMEVDDVGGTAVLTGRLLEGAGGGLATWADVKANAAKMGLVLTDADVGNAPLLRTNADGSVFRDANGHVEVVTDGGGNVVRSGHAFLLDMNPAAVPGSQLLNDHFVAGDGRINENYGLTAVHAVFHAEHNTMVDQIKAMLAEPGQTITMTGAQIFEAAKLVTEMEYQHIVFDEFARRISPNIEAFHGESYDETINAAISGEFAHAVYRLGHSMLRETVDAIDPTTGATTSNSLISAFLNPAGFNAVGGAGALALGMSMQVGSEIDEFVTGALRNNLLGLPLDLAAINITRGRDTGIPTLNELRAALFAVDGNASLAAYTSWASFGANLKNPGSLVNFITAYAFGDVAMSDIPAARALAQAAMTNTAFMNGTLTTGHALYDESQTFQDIDLWIGGLAEAKVAGGLLGSTFDAVFANQMVRLQNGDRLYYQSRLSEENILSEIDGENFADLIIRNTNVTHMHSDTFSAAQARVNLTAGADNSGAGRGSFALSEVIAGLAGNDTINGGGGSDSVYGDAGDDTLEGGAGNDILTGGEGNDTLTDSGGDDQLRGNEGDDVINAGAGIDLAHGGAGNDTIRGGAGDDEIFGGIGDDTAYGEAGRNHLKGGEGNDTLYAGNEDDNRLFGEVGNDTLVGGTGNDRTDGGEGEDVIIGGPGGNAALRESIDGDQGFDFASYAGASAAVTADLVNFLTVNTGDAQFDTYIQIEGLIGSSQGDTLRGNNLVNELRGELGNDTLQGRGGNDRLFGGLGTDTAVFAGNRSAYTVTLGASIIVAHNGGGADGTDTLNGIERLQFADQVVVIANIPASGVPIVSDTTPTEGSALGAQTAGITDANGMTGAVFSYQWQSLSGATWNNIGGATLVNFTPGSLQVNNPVRVRVSFTDDAGNAEQVFSAATGIVGDREIGNGSANSFNGTAGDDHFEGRGGNDTLNGFAGSDFLNGEGGNDTLNGGDGNDNLLGGAGVDRLDGGTGADVMAGQAGNDTYVVDNAGDVVTEATGGGTDLVESSLNGYTLAANVERLTLLGAGNIDGAGNTLANIITGNGGNNGLSGDAGNDTINGGAGNDTLNGGAGNDTLNGGTGVDTINGGIGNDTVTGGTGDDFLSAAEGNDILVFDAVGFGLDTISGFDSNAAGGQDRLSVGALGITAGNFATSVTIVQDFSDTLIAIGSDRIVLENVSAATVTQADFLLA